MKMKTKKVGKAIKIKWDYGTCGCIDMYINAGANSVCNSYPYDMKFITLILKSNINHALAWKFADTKLHAAFKLQNCLVFGIM